MHFISSIILCISLLYTSIYSIYIQYIHSRSQITFISVMMLSDLFFLIPVNLICRGMDILKYFRESIRLRYNESRL